MNKLGKSCLLALISASLFSFSQGLLAADETRMVAEMAPMKAALGQASARGEYFFRHDLAYGLGLEDVRQDGDHPEVEDRSTKLHNSIIWYPPLEEPYAGFFIGAGLMLERATIGRQQERSYVTGINPNAKYRYDRWVNTDHYLSFSQAVGYRYNPAQYFTLSLRFVIDELIMQTSTAQREEVYSYGVDTESPRRQAVKRYLSLNCGVRF